MRSIYGPRILIAQRLNFDCWAQILEKVVGRSDPVGAMEMAHLAVLLGRLKELASEDGPPVADMTRNDEHPDRFKPVYVVNDWGTLGYFIGSSLQRRNGTVSLNMQTDYQVRGPCHADMLWPDGTSGRYRIVEIEVETTIEFRPFTQHHLRVAVELPGLGTVVGPDISNAMIDPSTIVYEEP